MHRLTPPISAIDFSLNNALIANVSALSCSRIFVSQFFLLSSLVLFLRLLPDIRYLVHSYFVPSLLLLCLVLLSWLEYSGIYYFRLLSLSPNFALCSSFLNPYLDPTSSTLLAPLAYTLFLLRLRSWSCYPRSFAFFELKEVPFSLFSCLSWYLLSRHIVLALLTQSFSVQSLLFLPLLLYLSRYLLSRHVLVASNFLSFSQKMYIFFRIIFLYLFFILILFHRPCSSLPLKGTTSLTFVSYHSLYSLYIYFILTF